MDLLIWTLQFCKDFLQVLGVITSTHHGRALQNTFTSVPLGPATHTPQLSLTVLSLAGFAHYQSTFHPFGLKNAQ
ncbi:MAG: hypothetical protein RL497_1353 [Pseudomonadota bacterium]|jgi:hypothetical protein